MSLLLAATLIAGTLDLLTRLELASGSRLDRDETTALLGPALGLFAGGLGVSLLTAILMSILSGVMAVPVSRSSLNRRTGFKQMWVLVRHRLLALTGLSLLMLLVPLVPLGLLFVMAVAILTGMGPAGLLIVLPLGLGALAVTVWLSIKLLVAPAAVTIEELGVIDALRRSWALTTANWWRILGIVLVAGLIVGVIGQVVQIPITFAVGGISSTVTPHAGIEQQTNTDLLLTIIGMVVGGLVGALGFAFQSAVSALVYLDLRMRRDGLDVDLQRMLESGSDPDGVPGRGLPLHRPGGWQQGPGMGFPTG
ncbi:glycerophosphoryl diester phosphodiesterase membrane domain-containing protein [Arthrobacter celericrescens]|uniref:glycerophosphoryl diester phosphodiesterase membrane domain-containing protein n=1 Tax=Arthrobacter celericrescens TaxID=2320851 RepID=UPI001FDF3594|nr:glycerophosphoryl diester phosphodiesterase membrane domain-containing protein [Arthrobacter celericrescens]